MATRKSKGPSRKKSSKTKTGSPSKPSKIWELFVGYPPDDLGVLKAEDAPNLPNTYVTEYDLRGKGVMDDCDLPIAYSIFKETRSPFEALKVLVQADSMNLYPPRSIQREIARLVREFLQASGNKRLDECLGLVGKEGTQNYFSRSKKEARNLDLIGNMVLLKKTFNLSWPKCAELVSHLPNSSLKQKYILHQFRKNPFWINARKGFEQLRGFSYNTLEAQKSFIKRFPYNNLPCHLKPFHSEHHI